MNSTKTKISKKINKLKRTQNKKTQNIKRKITRLRRRAKRQMPVATRQTFRKQFYVLRQSNNSMRIRGCDLVYKIPNTLNITTSDVMTIIPANPAYWTGTRISAIAAGYQNYRPIKFQVTYVPHCAVTQQGNVLAGTLWSMSPSDENLQQTLKTSNGGMLTQCYVPKTTQVNLKSNLQFNLYRMGGKFDQESNPFIFIALAIATTDSNNNKIVPGYFYLNYEYELKNPIGNTVEYYNSMITHKIQTDYANITCVNCSLNSPPIGSILQFDNGAFHYNDQIINLDADAYVWYFCNKVGVTQPNVKIIKTIDADLQGNTMSEYVSNIQYKIFTDTDSNQIKFILYGSSSGNSVNPFIFSKAYDLWYTKSISAILDYVETARTSIQYVNVGANTVFLYYPKEGYQLLVNQIQQNNRLDLNDVKKIIQEELKNIEKEN